MPISRIEIENFKSIKKLDLPLNNINILIGANGAGKSNFIQFFNLLNKLVQQGLQSYVVANGGADNFLHFGRKNSEYLAGNIVSNIDSYQFKLTPTINNKFFFTSEISKHLIKENDSIISNELKTAHEESIWHIFLKEDDVPDNIKYLFDTISKLKIYHFNDTSETSKIKVAADINNNRYLYPGGGNIAAFLYLLKQKHPDYLTRIENTIKLIAPYFGSFILEPLSLNPEMIKLEWRHVGSDDYFDATHFSDGTLRMICLITLLLQPEMPDTIIIDEPELGLHPSAIELVAALIKSVAASGKQVICSTQSVTLLNHFQPEDIIVVDRSNGESLFSRPDKERLTEWLDAYSIGELWEKNILGGRP
jgi:predicted ATPase